MVYMTNTENYQIPLQNIVTRLAWLYRFDYAIVDGHDVFTGVSHDPCDLIYLCSTERTSITSKAFQRLVTEMFAQAALYGCIDVFFQPQKRLKEYSFPADYVRPLNYPYSEVYKSGNKTLCIDSQALHGLNINDSLAN